MPCRSIFLPGGKRVQEKGRENVIRVSGKIDLLTPRVRCFHIVFIAAEFLTRR
jgi:hypothetical protein